MASALQSRVVHLQMRNFLPILLLIGTAYVFEVQGAVTVEETAAAQQASFPATSYVYNPIQSNNISVRPCLILTILATAYLHQVSDLPSRSRAP